MTRMRERQREEEYIPHNEQEGNMIRQCKRKGGRKQRKYGSCRMIK
jgi:hypothetical protein